MHPNEFATHEMTLASGMIQRDPVDGVALSERTDVYLGYGQLNLYAVFVCFDQSSKSMRARWSMRDEIFDDDSVSIQLDTFRDRLRSYVFAANVHGVQGDTTWIEGKGFDLTYDTIYKSVGRRTNQGYLVLLSIPFRSLRFPSSQKQEWGFFVNRYIARTTENAFFPQYTSRIQGRLGQMGSLEGIEGIASGKNIQLIPYFALRNTRSVNFPNRTATPALRAGNDPAAGLDFKAVLHDKLVFDVAVNPDFSQVESDAPQSSANERFELFFPEKRPFFLENASYFDSPIQLLFTRRIEKPLFGLRTTGKLGAYSIGFLAADDRSPGENVLPGNAGSQRRAYFIVGRLSRDVYRESQVGAIFAERTFADRANVASGLDAELRINTNWRSAMQFLCSNTRMGNASVQGTGAYAALFRNGMHFSAQLGYQDFSPGFATDTGFVPRVDIRSVDNSESYLLRPGGAHLVTWGPSFSQAATWDHSGNLLDWHIGQGLSWNWRKATSFAILGDVGGTNLRPQDFPGIQRLQEFPYRNVELRFASTPANAVTASVTFALRRVVNFNPASGMLPSSANSLAGSAQLSLRPSEHLTIDNTYLYRQLSQPDSALTIFTNHILRSRWLYQFDQRWSIRLIAQYNELLVNQHLTSLGAEKRLNADLLIAYRVNPWTAVFLGVNEDLLKTGVNQLRIVGQTDPRKGFKNDGRSIFFKVSYLLHF
jgi:hypothetical protein